MSKKIRLWQIKGEVLMELDTDKLSYEEKLEEWIEKDVSIVDNNLLVIGRQVNTDFSGSIDLLCLDHNGDTVIIELKRDRTPRDVAAQALDYGAWINNLPGDRIVEIANSYLKGETLEEAFERKFGIQLPDTVNENHRLLIIASEMDSTTERIINYLSDAYGVGINVLTFQYFRDEHDSEYLGRVFLIEPEKVKTQGPMSKRRRNLSYEELEQIAENKGVKEIYKHLVDNLSAFFDSKGTTQSTIAFHGQIEGSRNTIFSIMPNKSDSEKGHYFYVYVK